MEDDWLVEFQISFDKFRQAVFGACRGSRKLHAEAEDVLGEILLRLTRIIRDNPGKIPTTGHLIKYARRMAAREASRQAQEAGRQRAVDPSKLVETIGPTSKPNNLPTREELLEALTKASPKIRQIFCLHLDGLTGKMIAENLGLPPSTVSKCLTAARKIIRYKSRHWDI